MVILDKLRRIPERLKKVGLAVATVVVCEIGARVTAPNLNGQVLQDFIQGMSGGWLLRVYDWLAGGALSRGALLALGIMPYVSARLFVAIARAAFPAVGELSKHEAGRTRLSRWTRVLTVGLALVQSYGFARFAQSIPGAVATPGIGFVVKTMVVLTAGATLIMLLTERFTRRSDADMPVVDSKPQEEHEESRVQALEGQDRGGLLLPPGEYVGQAAARERERVRV